MELNSEQNPVDHHHHDHKSLDSINDQLDSLSLEPDHGGEIQHDDTTTNNDNNGGGGGGGGDVIDGANSEERESEEKRENVSSKRSRYPVREGVEDCSFYLRTGMCKFGMNCKFNHPPNNKSQGGAKVKEKEECDDDDVGGPEKEMENEGSFDKGGQINCKYFDRPGGCKYGKACKFKHNRRTSATVELNFMGLPVRLGEKECPYYMRHGSCKFGANCRFNHPDPTSTAGADALPAYSNPGSILSSNGLQSTRAPWSPPAASNGSPPYVPLMFPPTQNVPPPSEWNAYQASVYPTERSMHLPPAYAMNSRSFERNVNTQQQEAVLVDEFPERPGQPECSYFLKTGNCKYRSACKFHHPKTAITMSPPCQLSDLGLPLRPGGSVCSFYNRYGICKYGPACKYDHPVNYAHSAALTVSPLDQTPIFSNSIRNDHAMAAGS